MKKPNLFGSYTPAGPINPSSFFIANTPQMAKRFGLQPDEVEVHCGMLRSVPSLVMVGTKEKPLSINGVKVNPEMKLQVLYNLPKMEPAFKLIQLINSELLVAGTLWNYIAMAFRGFMYLQGEIPRNELVKKEAFVKHRFVEIHDDAIAGFLASNQSPEHIEVDIDALFFANYMRFQVIKWANEKKSFDFDEFARIIKQTRQSNVGKLPFATIIL